MKKKNLILSLSFLIACMGSFYPAFANDNLLEPSRVKQNQTKVQPTNQFNFAALVDGFLTSDEKVPVTKNSIRDEFIFATQKFNQGNAKSAYDDYSALINKIDDDLCLFSLARVFSEIGFFSLSEKAIGKIVQKIQFENNISDLKKSYYPSYKLNETEEIKFAKAYSNIFFNASSAETISELTQKKDEFKLQQKTNDYFDFILANAYFEQKQYTRAINLINKALLLNPNNVNYEILKADILIAQKKPNEALNIYQKLEKNKNLISFLDKIQLKKELVLAKSAKKESERKYHLALKSYKETDFEKTKKECLSVLTFDKDNDKILSLYAQSELALGAVERAGTYFINSYKIEKNNPNTLIGLGDVRYIHGDYKNSIKAYKKALKSDKTNYEIIIKLLAAQNAIAQNPKEIQKLENLIDKAPKSVYLDYYKSAISIAQKNSVLKESYLERSIAINPNYEPALGELVKLKLKNKNYKSALDVIYNTSFTLEKNYYYYYLLGLYNEAINKNKDAIGFYRASLNLKPEFEMANIKLLNLIPAKNTGDSFDEEI